MTCTVNDDNQYIIMRDVSLTYDVAGNVNTYASWTYSWDNENRLTQVVSTSKLIQFTYDTQGRRIEKKVWNNTTGTGTPATYLKYIYDGWNLIAELNGNSNNAKVRTYTWGLDISGSTTEAGGVGGLLFIDDSTNGVHFVSYDPNGNIMGLVKATNGTISASYEYGPFSELLVSTGTMSSSNPFRFSTKYRDTETDLYYYGYRYYSSSLGRWISRDPVEEQGGLNLYAFVNNDPVNHVDILREPIRMLYLGPTYDPKTNIQLCCRNLEGEECSYDGSIIICINCLRPCSHSFFRWPSMDFPGEFSGLEIIGTEKNGDLPRKKNDGLEAMRCKRCYRSYSFLKYGIGKFKKALYATEQEIQDCLSKRGIIGDYGGLCNNCNKWSKGAAKDCGLTCY